MRHPPRKTAPSRSRLDRCGILSGKPLPHGRGSTGATSSAENRSLTVAARPVRYPLRKTAPSRSRLDRCGILRGNRSLTVAARFLLSVPLLIHPLRESFQLYGLQATSYTDFACVPWHQGELPVRRPRQIAFLPGVSSITIGVVPCFGAPFSSPFGLIGLGRRRSLSDRRSFIESVKAVVV